MILKKKPVNSAVVSKDNPALDDYTHIVQFAFLTLDTIHNRRASRIFRARTANRNMASIFCRTAAKCNQCSFARLKLPRHTFRLPNNINIEICLDIVQARKSCARYQLNTDELIPTNLFWESTLPDYLLARIVLLRSLIKPPRTGNMSTGTANSPWFQPVKNSNELPPRHARLINDGQ